TASCRGLSWCRPGASPTSPWLPPLTTARQRGDHMHGVAVTQRGILPTEEARVLVVDEEREVRSQFAVFVAEALFERRVALGERVQRLPQRGRVELHLPRAAGKAPPR